MREHLTHFDDCGCKSAKYEEEIALLKKNIEIYKTHDAWAEADALEMRALSKEMLQSASLRWTADMRAIKQWQEANPGNDLVWPDHADLVMWITGRLREAEMVIDVLRRDEPMSFLPISMANSYRFKYPKVVPSD